MTEETVAERVWRQASSGVLDRERLLPSGAAAGNRRSMG